MAKFRAVSRLVGAAVIITFIASGTLASHRSRARGSAPAERSSRSRGREKTDARSRGRRGERLSRAERRRSRSERYSSTRRGRRYEARRDRRHRVYYESGEPTASSTRPSSTGIPAQRVTEIQRALIKEGYLEGQPSGQYDDPTIEAMKEFQEHNGFPASGMPSAPALKKLGVAKRTNNGYAVPINSATEDQKPSQTAPQVKKGKGQEDKE